MKIIAIGMNYAAHNEEMRHTRVNTDPVIFMKPDSAILKDGKPFLYPIFQKRYIMKPKWLYASIVWVKT